MSKLFLMVGLPGAGKTERALELAEQQQALRLTPDEWMIPLFGESDADGKRDVLEGRLIWLALEVLRGGMDVVLDFGLWSREERSALRWLAHSVHAEAEVVYLPVEPAEQLDRIQQRWERAPHTTFALTPADLALYRQQFEVPDPDELAGAAVGDPPTGDTWRAWACKRWPSFPAS